MFTWLKRSCASMNTQTSTKSLHQRDVREENTIIRLGPDPSNENIGNDATFAIELCRRFFKVLGVWPITDTGVFSWNRMFSNVLVFACYYGIGIRSIPSMFYLIFDEKKRIDQLKILVRLIFVYMGATKYILLRYHRKNIEKCMKHIELDWLKLECTASRNIMLEYARFGRMLVKICAAFTYASAVFFAILPIGASKLLGQKGPAVNVNETVSSVKSFTVPSHFFFSVCSETPLYEFIYWSQVIATFMLHSINNACYSLAVVIVMHACGQLKILMEKLNELVDGGGKITMYDSVDSRMSDIIKHHVMVLRFISFAENMLRGICLVELGGYTFEMCFLGYFSVLEFRAEPKHLIAIIAWTTIFITFIFNVFSFCYIAELLTQECINVGQVTYLIDWHRLPGNKPLDLGLAIAMAQSPVTLTAGGAIQLSMRCFATIMRTVLGYVNLLRTMMA